MNESAGLGGVGAGTAQGLAGCRASVADQVIWLRLDFV